jgi:hypothetical protein
LADGLENLVEWKNSLIVVTPETVVSWGRAGFRLYWKLISRPRAPGGRFPKEVRELIVKMVLDNPTRGASRSHGELLMLSFDVSERTVSRWMRRAPTHPEPLKRWLFCEITVKRLPQWISSPCRRSHLVLSTASSSATMTGGKSCISTLLSIPPACESCSDCDRLSLSKTRPAFLFSTAAPNTASKFQLPYDLC